MADQNVDYQDMSNDAVRNILEDALEHIEKLGDYKDFEEYVIENYIDVRSECCDAEVYTSIANDTTLCTRCEEHCRTYYKEKQ